MELAWLIRNLSLIIGGTYFIKGGAHLDAEIIEGLGNCGK